MPSSLMEIHNRDSHVLDVIAVGGKSHMIHSKTESIATSDQCHVIIITRRH